MQQKTFLCFCAVISVLFFSIAEAHVLGIDFGSEYIKIAGPHGDRGVDIVLNEMSQRKTDNFIGFRFGERYIGTEAKSLAARFPTQTVCAVNRLLSAPSSADHDLFNALKYEFLYEDKGGMASVPLADPKGPFFGVELYSMLLTYAAKVAVNDGVPDPKTIVVTAPAGASFYYRWMLNTAAKLSGMKLLGLTDSTSATAYYYGMRHRGFGDKNVSITVVDIGASHIEVGVFQYSPPEANAKKSAALGTITKLAVDSDFSFGGRVLDLCIAEIIEAEAKEKINIQNVIGVKKEKELKAQFALLRAAKNIRETLSVNSDTPYTVEGIAGDRDFSSTFSRAVFEEKCGHFLKKVPDLVEKVVEKSGIGLEKLSSLELMGGVSRTPKLITDLKGLLGRDISRTLNMDEAAALGAGYYAAKLSPFYHAKSFAFRERLGKNIYFTLSPQLSATSMPRELLQQDSLLGDMVSVTLNRTEDFTINIYEDDDNAEVTRISVRNVGEALKSVSSYDPTTPNANNTHIIRLQVRLTETGLLEVDEVEAVIRYSVQISSKEVRNETDPDGHTRVVEEIVPKTRVRVKTVSLDYTLDWNFLNSYSNDQYTLSHDKLRSIDVQEEEKHQRSQSKNNLESYLFWAKAEGVIENSDTTSRLGEDGVQQFFALLQSTQIWLEEEGGSDDSCPKSEYESKLQALQDLLEQLLNTQMKDNATPENSNTEATEGDL